MSVDTPTREHFRPDRSGYTQFVCVGPKFLTSVFVTTPVNEDERRRRRFARKLVDWWETESSRSPESLSTITSSTRLRLD
ncbi:hypothetical protein [Halobaculum sp. MBLA0143]|uniref:hypothetical protein n=1 Tax=Halobaculum sp. MBLA0143 TaxID=3079933 RepID=UPI003523F21A